MRDLVKRFGKVQIDDVRWLPATSTVRQEVVGLEEIGDTGLTCDETVLLVGEQFELFEMLVDLVFDERFQDFARDRSK